MKRLCSAKGMGALLVCGLMWGCRTPRDVHFLGDAELNYYKNKSLAVEYPNIDQMVVEEVSQSKRPHTLRERERDEIWDMTLVEAIHTAVNNNKLIRTRGNPQLNQNSPSVYDPALRDTGFLFGNRGVEAALADFDANLTSTITWGKNEQYANLRTARDFVNVTESGVFTSQ
ncbi:MAG: TolC family protein, partial [Planctomycetes bacterium]|nr:TolC family protein [Planctomycetota bacterium]